MRRTLLVLALLSLQSCSCSPKQTHQSAGVLNVTETALDFGALCPRPDGPDVLVSSLTRTVHLSNGGTTLLYVNKFEVDAAFQDQFVVDPAKVPKQLDVNESAVVPVSFTPKTAGEVSAKLTIEGDDPEQAPSVVRLHGSGKSTPIDPALTMSCPGGKWSNDTCAAANPTIFFADAVVGSTGTITLTLGNTGCPPMVVKDFVISGPADPAQGSFALADGQPGAVAIPGGGTTPVKLRFSPLVKDTPLSGTLSFTTNAPASHTVSLQVQGIGVYPALSLAPLTCDFTLLATPCDGAFTLTNTSSQPVSVQSVTLQAGNAMFKINKAPAAGAVIQPLGAETIEVGYTPAIDRAQDSLVVSFVGTTAQALLTGGSPPVLSTDPAALDFGDKKVAGQDYYLPVTIKNVGTYNQQLPLTIMAVQIDQRFPSNASAFELAANPADPAGCPGQPAAGASVLPLGSLETCVHFKAPAGGGSFVANLLIQTDDPIWPDPGYLLSISASTDCNRAPVAVITAPLTTACPCSGSQLCVGQSCQATGSLQVKLAQSMVDLSAEQSYDLVADKSGGCTTSDPASVTSWQWSIARRPATSQATLSSNGAATTSLTVDREGHYTVQLVVLDKTSLPSAPVTFDVEAVP